MNLECRIRSSSAWHARADSGAERRGLTDERTATDFHVSDQALFQAHLPWALGLYCYPRNSSHGAKEKQTLRYARRPKLLRRSKLWSAVRALGRRALRVTCHSEHPQQPLAAIAYVSETSGLTHVVSGERSAAKRSRVARTPFFGSAACRETKTAADRKDGGLRYRNKGGKRP